MQLQEKYVDQIDTLALNIDFDEATGSPSSDLVGKIEDTLQRMSVPVQNVVSSTPMEDVLGEFEVFGLPAVLVFDASGELSRKFDGDVDYDRDIFPLVDELLSN